MKLSKNIVSNISTDYNKIKPKNVSKHNNHKKPQKKDVSVSGSASFEYVSNTDSSTILSLISANSMDSSEVLALIKADSGETSIMSNFQKDSANGIGFDSSQGRFFVPINTLTSTKFSSPVSLLIKDSSGSTLKTIRSPGS